MGLALEGNGSPMIYCAHRKNALSDFVDNGRNVCYSMHENNRIAIEDHISPQIRCGSLYVVTENYLRYGVPFSRRWSLDETSACLAHVVSWQDHAKHRFL